MEQKYHDTMERLELSQESKQRLLDRVRKKADVGDEEKKRKVCWYWVAGVVANVLLITFLFLPKLTIRQGMKCEDFSVCIVWDNMLYEKLTDIREKQYYGLSETITPEQVGKCIVTISEKNIGEFDISFEKYIGQNVYLLRNAVNRNIVIVNSTDGYEYFVFREFVAPGDDLGNAICSLESEENLPIKRYMDFFGMPSEEEISYIEVVELIHNGGNVQGLGNYVGGIEDKESIRQIYSEIAPVCPMSFDEYVVYEQFDLQTEGKTEWYNQGSCLLRFISEDGGVMELKYYPRKKILEKASRFYLIDNDTNMFLREKTEEALEDGVLRYDEAEVKNNTVLLRGIGLAISLFLLMLVIGVVPYSKQSVMGKKEYYALLYKIQTSEDSGTRVVVWLPKRKTEKEKRG